MTTLRARSNDPTHHKQHGPGACKGTDNTPTRTFTYKLEVSEDWLRNCEDGGFVAVAAKLAFREWAAEQKRKVR